MKPLSHIFLWLACAIMFLHNMTPHSHADHSGDIKAVFEDISNSDAEGWLELLFSQDLGEGHLEFYKNSNADLDIQFFTADFFKQPFIEIGNYIGVDSLESLMEIHPPPDDQSPITQNFTSSLSLRGPPVAILQA